MTIARLACLAWLSSLALAPANAAAATNRPLSTSRLVESPSASFTSGPTRRRRHHRHSRRQRNVPHQRRRKAPAPENALPRNGAPAGGWHTADDFGEPLYARGLAAIARARSGKASAVIRYRPRDLRHPRSNRTAWSTRSTVNIFALSMGCFGLFSVGMRNWRNPSFAASLIRS
jgi:hypothetical protein